MSLLSPFTLTSPRVPGSPVQTVLVKQTVTQTATVVWRGPA